jgi:hypothetical protein
LLHATSQAIEAKATACEGARPARRWFVRGFTSTRDRRIAPSSS